MSTSDADHAVGTARGAVVRTRQARCLDGTVCMLRAIGPDDADGLVAFHQRLSMHTTYLRFFSCHPELSATEVARFTQVDLIDRVGIVAVLNGAIIAVGRFDRIDDTTKAEAAFVVADEFQHRGIGTQLLEALIDEAVVRGITELEVNTLAENRAMLDVVLRSGLPVTRTRDHEVVTLVVSLTAHAGSAR